MSITKRTIKGITYLIERTSYRDEQGRPRTKDKVIGKVDAQTGETVPTRKGKKSQTTPPKIKNDVIIPEIVDDTAEKPYKTEVKAKAGSDARIADANIHSLALPTLFEFENAISLYQSGKAHLYPVISTKGLRFENGEIFFEGETLHSISVAELQDMLTREGIEKIDIPLLTVYYSIILKEFYSSLQAGEPLNPIITMYAPDLMRCLGLLRDGSGIHKSDVSNLMRKTQTFHDVIGILDTQKNGKRYKKYFPVLLFMGYDESTNLIRFSSPYLNHIIETIYNASLSRDKHGSLRKYKSSRQITNPSHSYLVKPSIAKERNKAAVENVFIIVRVIEQAGNNTPHIKASTLIERNEALKTRLEQDKHTSTLLKSVFTKTWELLRDQTRLLEVYSEIVLPNPEDAQNIPTASTLKEITFTFRHNGKKNQ